MLVFGYNRQSVEGLKFDANAVPPSGCVVAALRMPSFFRVHFQLATSWKNVASLAFYRVLAPLLPLERFEKKGTIPTCTCGGSGIARLFGSHALFP